MTSSGIGATPESRELWSELIALARDVEAMTPEQREHYAREERRERSRALYGEILDYAREYLAQGYTPAPAIALAERFAGERLKTEQRRRMLRRLGGAR